MRTRELVNNEIALAVAEKKTLHDRVNVLNSHISDLQKELKGIAKAQEYVVIGPVVRAVRWMGNPEDLDDIAWLKGVYMCGDSLYLNGEEVPVGHYLVYIPNGSIVPCAEAVFDLFYALV